VGEKTKGRLPRVCGLGWVGEDWGEEVLRLDNSANSKLASDARTFSALLHPSPCNERFVAMDAAVLHCVCGVHAVTVTHAADAVRYECEHLQSAPTRCIHVIK
jgi:hypothetical protein